MARFERKKSQNWQQRFLALLPVIVNYVRPAFRELGPEAKAEAVQEAVANALVAYARLVEQGRESVAFPTGRAVMGFPANQHRKSEASFCAVE